MLDYVRELYQFPPMTLEEERLREQGDGEYVRVPLLQSNFQFAIDVAVERLVRPELDLDHLATYSDEDDSQLWNFVRCALLGQMDAWELRKDLART